MTLAISLLNITLESKTLDQKTLPPSYSKLTEKFLFQLELYSYIMHSLVYTLALGKMVLAVTTNAPYNIYNSFGIQKHIIYQLIE